MASLVLLPAALALEVLPHVRRCYLFLPFPSVPPPVRLSCCGRRVPCTPLWRTRPAPSCGLCLVASPGSPFFDPQTDRSPALGVVITLAFQLGVVLVLARHAPDTFAVVSQAQPLTALPLSILLAATGARACPEEDAVLIGGNDALQQVKRRERLWRHWRQFDLTRSQFTGPGAALNISGLVCICVGLVFYFWQLRRQNGAESLLAVDTSVTRASKSDFCAMNHFKVLQMPSVYTFIQSI
jgi:hypothetical protein